MLRHTSETKASPYRKRRVAGVRSPYERRMGRPLATGTSGSCPGAQRAPGLRSPGDRLSSSRSMRPTVAMTANDAPLPRNEEVDPIKYPGYPDRRFSLLLPCEATSRAMATHTAEKQPTRLERGRRCEYGWHLSCSLRALTKQARRGVATGLRPRVFLSAWQNWLPLSPARTHRLPDATDTKPRND